MLKPKNVVLFLSPHLDDVAFSCAGQLMNLQNQGRDVRLVTIFTRSVPDPQGFALRCQTDKGIAPDVDYMALRRAEDLEFARIVGLDPLEQVEHWEFPEAPHRGYDSPSALFAGMRPDDTISEEIGLRLLDLVSKTYAGFIYAPQGLGNHVDHLQVIRALMEAKLTGGTFWYRDTPYAIRDPEAQPSSLLPAVMSNGAYLLDQATLERKIAGSCAYASQIGFQFGGPQGVRDKMTAFHAQEAERAGLQGYAERMMAPPFYSPWPSP